MRQERTVLLATSKCSLSPANANFIRRCNRLNQPSERWGAVLSGGASMSGKVFIAIEAPEPFKQCMLSSQITSPMCSVPLLPLRAQHRCAEYALSTKGHSTFYEMGYHYEKRERATPGMPVLALSTAPSMYLPGGPWRVPVD